MDLSAFSEASPGILVPITGTDPVRGPWSHFAFVPEPLSERLPVLDAGTYRVVADARAALAALDSTAEQLPNPRLLRRSSLHTEAQSTSSLEGTYAPLAEVLTADDERPGSADLREVLNYVKMADAAFDWLDQGRRVTVSLVAELQKILVAGTRSETESAGSLRHDQVVIGRRANASLGELPVRAARFVPQPPGIDLRANLGALLEWMDQARTGDLDPVVAAAMAHYQFEALHPFSDGNGRIGRLLVIMHLLRIDVLSEPTLTVSPWFEARRTDYYDRLLGVSTAGDWDGFVRFFARGLAASAVRTRRQMVALVGVQKRLNDRVRDSRLRAESAHALVDLAVGHPSFTVKTVEIELGLSYGRANTLVGQLVELGVLRPLDPEGSYRRRFTSPEVLRALMAD